MSIAIYLQYWQEQKEKIFSETEENKITIKSYAIPRD